MRALQTPGAHIPYRESTLTSVLRNSLGGECRAVFVVTLSLDSEDLAETVASCRCVRLCSRLIVPYDRARHRSQTLVAINIDAEGGGGVKAEEKWILNDPRHIHTSVGKHQTRVGTFPVINARTQKKQKKSPGNFFPLRID